MNKDFNNTNGFSYVDLCLPSGTLWATCNVGASNPSDFGLYFQWGDVQGYTFGQVGLDEGQKKFAIDWSDYKWGAAPNFTKYKRYSATLELEDDAAHVNMGGDWHIPTTEQCQELIDNTTSEWTTPNDVVQGMTFTSKKDPSKSIFIPASGIAWGGSINGSGDGGLIWSSMLNNGGVGNGQILGCWSDSVSMFSYVARFDGIPVRGVIG